MRTKPAVTTGSPFMSIGTWAASTPGAAMSSSCSTPSSTGPALVHRSDPNRRRSVISRRSLKLATQTRSSTFSSASTSPSGPAAASVLQSMLIR